MNRRTKTNNQEKHSVRNKDLASSEGNVRNLTSVLQFKRAARHTAEWTSWEELRISPGFREGKVKEILGKKQRRNWEVQRVDKGNRESGREVQYENVWSPRKRKQVRYRRKEVICKKISQETHLQTTNAQHNKCQKTYPVTAL